MFWPLQSANPLSGSPKSQKAHAPIERSQRLRKEVPANSYSATTNNKMRRKIANVFRKVASVDIETDVQGHDNDIEKDVTTKFLLIQVSTVPPPKVFGGGRVKDPTLEPTITVYGGPTDEGMKKTLRMAYDSIMSPRAPLSHGNGSNEILLHKLRNLDEVERHFEGIKVNRSTTRLSGSSMKRKAQDQPQEVSEEKQESAAPRKISHPTAWRDQAEVPDPGDEAINNMISSLLTERDADVYNIIRSADGSNPHTIDYSLQQEYSAVDEENDQSLGGRVPLQEEEDEEEEEEEEEEVNPNSGGLGNQIEENNTCSSVCSSRSSSSSNTNRGYDSGNATRSKKSAAT